MAMTLNALRSCVASLALAAPALGFAASQLCPSNPTPPAGAQALGYTKQLFCVAPTLSDIAPTDSAMAKLYSGTWYAKAPIPLSKYAMSGSTLVLDNGGGLMTETRSSAPAVLPLLLASAGFYVEFSESISDNDSDHFPAVWLMPQEHNLKHTDHLSSDPAGDERWMELDIDEGGYNTGHHGAMISWYGHYPNYQHATKSNDPSQTFGMDRTKTHVFGLSYDPKAKQVTWWVDGQSTGSVSTADVPSLVNDHHYYLLMNNQNHGANKPYQMYLHYFSAWSGQDVPKPPSGVTATPQ
jgi:hypothetical protein